MSLLVVGSIAYDSVKTPFGMTEEQLGGAAVYFSYAASFLTDVRLVGVVGEDFETSHVDAMKAKNIDTAGLVVKPGKTFRWAGKYDGDMNTAETLDVQLNVFGDFKPVLPDHYKDSEFVFLANGHPALQMSVMDQVSNPTLTLADTMNFWIDNAHDDLMKMISRVDGLIINDGEAKQLTGRNLTIAAGKDIMKLGPKILVIKKGEHGALLFFENDVFAVPAYPLEEVLDPTGAGDSFAGGFMGYLAATGEPTRDNLRRALIYGTVLASINVENFSLRRFQEIDRDDIKTRAQSFMDMLRFE